MCFVQLPLKKCIVCGEFVNINKSFNPYYPVCSPSCNEFLIKKIKKINLTNKELNKINKGKCKKVAKNIGKKIGLRKKIVYKEIKLNLQKGKNVF